MHVFIKTSCKSVARPTILPTTMSSPPSLPTVTSTYTVWIAVLLMTQLTVHQFVNQSLKSDSLVFLEKNQLMIFRIWLILVDKNNWTSSFTIVFVNRVRYVTSVGLCFCCIPFPRCIHNRFAGDTAHYPVSLYNRFHRRHRYRLVQRLLVSVIPFPNWSD